MNQQIYLKPQFVLGTDHRCDRQKKCYRINREDYHLQIPPQLLRLGLKPEQIAQELELDLEIVRELIASQNN